MKQSLGVRRFLDTCVRMHCGVLMEQRPIHHIWQYQRKNIVLSLKKSDQEYQALTQHAAGKTVTSVWSLKSFRMVVYETKNSDWI